MSFPLRRLPLVVLSILFNCLNPEELIRLSFLSKRCYALTKALRKKPKNELEIYFSSFASVGFDYQVEIGPRFEVSEFSDIPEDAQLEFLIIGGVLPCFVSMDRQRDIMNIYCQNDRFEGLTALSNYIANFYGIQIDGVIIGANENIDDPRRIIDWLMNRQGSVRSCHFECRISGNSELRYLFNNFKVLNSLVINVKTNDRFRYTFRQPITTDSIEFGRSLWLTIDNLLDMNCRVLSMKDTFLTSENMNFFLRNWLMGGNSNLGCMNFEMRLIDIEVILNGLEVIERDHAEGIEYHCNDKGCIKFVESYELMRNDGTTASIVIENGEFEEFCMCVWPDFNGKPYPVQE